MQTYIALLRGINVGGHNKIKMADLKALFKNEGFLNITTYIQSGNVIFQSNIEYSLKIEELIKQAILKLFNYNIQVLVLTKTELIKVFKNNPFLKIMNIDVKKLHVTLLKQTPKEEDINCLKLVTLTNNDEFEIVNKSIYIYYPISYAKTKLNNNLIEKKLQSSSTSRNLRTITKLVELSDLE